MARQESEEPRDGLQHNLRVPVLQIRTRQEIRTDHLKAISSGFVNATGLGLLSKEIIFKDDAEREEFMALLRELERDYQPVGRVKHDLVEEIAVCTWKMGRVNGLEQREILSRKQASGAVVRAISANRYDDPLPLFVNDDGSRSEAQLAWEVRELTVRTGTSTSAQEATYEGRERSATDGSVQIEAKLATSFENVLRYSAMIKRDYYRAIRTLRELQREDLESNPSGRGAKNGRNR